MPLNTKVITEQTPKIV